MPSYFGLAKLGRDAELRHTPKGDAVANLALAFTYGQKVDGKRPTQWVDASIWGARAASLAPYLLKGTAVSVIIEEVHVETFTKSDGTQAFKMVGRISSLDFAGSPQKASDPAPPPAKPATQSSGGLASMSDDIPFSPLFGRKAHYL